jgi:hypothetical protein
LTIYNFGVVVADVKRTASLEDMTMGGHFERARLVREQTGADLPQ